MTKNHLGGVTVSGIASAVPFTQKYTDEYIDYYGEKEIKKFKESTGILSRNISITKQTASDLCYVAARKLLDEKGYDRVDALVFITQTPDYRLPSTAFVLQKRLNLNKDCICFDINLGCSAFVTGLFTVAGMISGGVVERALLLIGDAFQEHTISDDHSQTMMFGDAGVAVLVEKGEGSIDGMIYSDGDGYKYIISPYGGFRKPVLHNGNPVDCIEEVMDGNDVFLFTITKVPKQIKQFLTITGKTLDSYDYLVLHQANKMVIDKIAKKLGAEQKRVLISLDEFGNTNGASIPITICKNFGEEASGRTIKLLTSGFGVGMQHGVVSFDISLDNVFPIIYSDDYYEEGFDI